MQKNQEHLRTYGRASTAKAELFSLGVSSELRENMSCAIISSQQGGSVDEKGDQYGGEQDRASRHLLWKGREGSVGAGGNR